MSGRRTSVDELNSVFKDAENDGRWKGIFATSEEPLVSSDIIGRRELSIVDLSMTRVVDGDLIKILAWYDNETAYAYSLLLHVIETAKYIYI